MKTPKLYGIFLGTNGSVLLCEMTKEERNDKIQRMIGATRTEKRVIPYAVGGTDVVCITNYYAKVLPGNLNSAASYLCGGDVYGNAVILRYNELGFSCLMNLRRARQVLDALVC